MMLKTVRDKDANSLIIHDKVNIHDIREYKSNNKNISVDILKCKISQCCDMHSCIGWKNTPAIDRYIVDNWSNTCQKMPLTLSIVELLAYKDITDITL